MSGASSSTRTSTAASRAPSRPPRSAHPVPSPTERCDMTNGLSSPRAGQGPRAPEASPAPEAARGAPPPSDAFAGILRDAQHARTPTAEGQSPEKPTAADDCGTPTAAAPSAEPSADGDTPTPTPTSTPD